MGYIRDSVTTVYHPGLLFCPLLRPPLPAIAAAAGCCRTVGAGWVGSPSGTPSLPNDLPINIPAPSPKRYALAIHALPTIAPRDLALPTLALPAGDCSRDSCQLPPPRK